MTTYLLFHVDSDLGLFNIVRWASTIDAENERENVRDQSARMDVDVHHYYFLILPAHS